MKEFMFLNLELRGHMSPSFLSTMLACSMKGVLGSILRLPFHCKSPALTKGKIIHKALENYFLKIKSKSAPRGAEETFSECLHQAVEFFKKQKKELIDEDVLKQSAEILESNSALITGMGDFLANNFEYQTHDAAIDTEQTYDEIIIKKKKFKGQLDLRYDRRLIDFKTAGQDHPKDPLSNKFHKMKLRQEFKQQLLVYKKAIEQKTDIIIESYEIHEFILTKNFKIYSYMFTPEEIQSAEKELFERIDLVDDILRNNKISRNYRNGNCPCEYAEYCLDEENLKMLLSKPKPNFLTGDDL